MAYQFLWGFIDRLIDTNNFTVDFYVVLKRFTWASPMTTFDVIEEKAF